MRIALLLLLTGATGAASQDVPDDPKALVRRLVTAEGSEPAIRAIRAAGAAAVPPLLAALEAVARRRDLAEPEALRLLAALDALRQHTAPHVERLADLLPRAEDPAAFTALVQVLGTAVTWCDADAARGVAEALPQGQLHRLSMVAASQEDYDRAIHAWQRLRYRSELRADTPLPKLIHAIEVEHAATAKEAAIDLCAARGPAAKAALPALAARLEAPTARLRAPGPQIDLRRPAALAILAIAETAAEGLPAHAWLAEHGDVREMMEAFDAIRTAGEAAGQALPALMRIAAGGDAAVRRREAVITIGVLGSAARDAVPLLERIAGGDDPAMAKFAAAALGRVRGR